VYPRIVSVSRHCKPKHHRVPVCIVPIRPRLRFCVPVPLSSGNVSRTTPLGCLIRLTAHRVWMGSVCFEVSSRACFVSRCFFGCISVCPCCRHWVMSASLCHCMPVRPRLCICVSVLRPSDNVGKFTSLEFAIRTTARCVCITSV